MSTVISARTFEELVQKLPPDLQQELWNFAKYLLETKVGPGEKHLRLTWAGALREFRNQVSSLELQKKALEWWGD